MIEKLSCHACGQHAVLSHFHPEPGNNVSEYSLAIVCKWCGHSGPRVKVDNNDERPRVAVAVQGAIERWNSIQLAMMKVALIEATEPAPNRKGGRL